MFLTKHLKAFSNYLVRFLKLSFATKLILFSLLFKFLGWGDIGLWMIKLVLRLSLKKM
jgi:hypothetical protein